MKASSRASICSFARSTLAQHPLKVASYIRYTHIMPKKKATQKTPKGHEIPVPRREDFLDDLKKAASPSPEKDSESRCPKK